MGSPPDPSCPACSKSFWSGTLVLYEHGEFFHLGCRSHQLRRHALYRVAHAQATREQTARRVPELSSAFLKYPRPSRRSHEGACPFCGRRATVTDWRPSVDWLVIEDCPCNGFFLWAGLPTARLTKLTRDTRKQLVLRVREFRARGREAWCTTEDGTETGPLVVRTERPDRLM
jgi:hypothetical protein